MTSQSAPLSIPLAVVGLSAVFPKSANLDEFWSNIRHGVDAITEIPSTHWDPDDYFDANQKTPDMTYARRGGFLSPLPFDPLEFGISPNNLEAIDTSQLLGLVGAKRALEHAGYGNGRQFDRSRVGCILGVTGTLELVIPLGARLGHPRWRKALKDAGVPDEIAEDVVNRISNSYVPWQENSFPGLLGNVVAGRIANKLDLHGTNCVVDAACASSLSAIHLAALELTTGRSDMVVTGGIDTFNDIFMFMCFSKTPALSPSGNSKPFSNEADGTILGEGVGMLVLKRLADAERDGDRIYAVLKGIGTSSDGAGTAVYAPKKEGQIRCLQDAYRIAGVSPETIELMEAHGTGTKVGDATEVSGLMEVYQSTTRKGPWCAIGSIKSQIGHTKAAAGAAGLIKAVLALQHRVLPPTIKVNQPPAAFLAPDSPFYVNTEARPWVKPRDYPRRAAVSAFGFGGSNFHCVLEESPQSFEAPAWNGDVQVIALSAISQSELIAQIQSKVTPLAKAEWNDVRTLAASTRQSFQPTSHFRLLLVIERDKTDITKLATSSVTMLTKYPEKATWSTPDGADFGQGGRQGKLGILVPGQGAQYVGMLRELACQFPAMIEVLDEANDVFSGASSNPSPAKRLSDFIYPPPAFSPETRSQQDLELRATQIAQPAIGAVSLAVLSVLELFGVQPEAVAGHSYGELTALCASRRFTPRSLYRLSALRGRLMAAAQENDGGMLAVLAPLNQIQQVLREQSLDLVVANHNSPTQVVLSGRIPDIDRAASLFASRSIRGKRLPVAAAFHSPLVAPASSEFRPVLDEIDFAPSSMPVYANSTATQYPSEPNAARDLLANQLALPVHFVHEIEQMYADGVRSFLEVGPGNVLTGLVNSILDGRDFRAVSIDASSGKRNGVADLAAALATLSASGYAIRWDQWDPAWMKSVETPPKSRLLIPICGANYMKPREPIPPRAALTWPSQSEEPKQPVESNPTGVPEVVTVNMATTASASPANFEADTIQANGIERAQMDGTKQSSQETSQPITLSTSANGETLDVIRETLATLQRLQQETARLHQQFLDGQVIAIQTLQQLAERQFQSKPAANESNVRGTEWLPSQAWSAEPNRVANSSSITTPSVPKQTDVHHDRTSPIAPQQSSLHETVATVTPSLPVTPTAVADVPPSIERHSTPRADAFNQASVSPTIEKAFSLPIAASTELSKMGSTVLHVVSEKTGYPVEMLNLEMSLDHDLGIDSIKRVEILSALQEKVPNLPSFQPDELGSLHTLRDVVTLADARISEPAAVVAVEAGTGALRSQSPLAASVPARTGVPQPPAAPVSVEEPVSAEEPKDNSALGSIVLAVVSEKTGYPPEMLNVDMSLDHDLGIDSIKRVEILSALQERVPGLPAFQPEELGALHTLNDVVNLANSRTLSAPVAAPQWAKAEPSELASSAKPSSLSNTVLEVVSEKTGYPVEMLNLEMSLDHDLGIDSIKRVEILSALQERVPNLPAFQPEELGALHTLHDVVTIADARSGPSRDAVKVESAPPQSPAPKPEFNASVPATSSTTPIAPAAPVVALAVKESLSGLVLEVVSDKTGYPVEMLNLDMSLDHDLGIDSIKRVEILSALQERVPQLPAFQPEELGALHTLSDVVMLADARTGAAPTSTTSAEPTPVASVASTQDTPAPRKPSRVIRSVVNVVPLAPAPTRSPINIFPGSEIWITEDGLGLSLLVADKLNELGFKPRIVNLEEPQSAAIPETLAGLVIIAPQRPMGEKQLWTALEWFQRVGPTLRRVGASSPTLVATVSRLDGHFGFSSDKRLRDPISGGLAGLLKCARLEWPEVHARAFDLSAEWSAPHVAAAMLVTELFCEGPAEVGLTPSGPVALEVVESPLSVQFESPPIRPGEVVVISGGARGVTAEAAHAIAKAWKPNLIIFGRSPEPSPEPEWLNGLKDEASIRKALIARASAGTTPRAIETQFREILAGREVTKQLQRIRATGASVIYRSVDIRDANALRPILAQIRRDFGDVRGIIHGAGVLADHRIEDKTKEQFDRVYQTKVDGLNTLFDCVNLDGLRFVGLFSSYTARFGRIGQVDYAIANEVLNKQARQLSAMYPNCRVASFNWGPWDGGMVNDNLKKVFSSEGVGLIPIEEGADAVVDELLRSNERSVEVLMLAADPNQPTKPTASPEPTLVALPAAHVTQTPAIAVPTRPEAVPSVTQAAQLPIEQPPVAVSDLTTGYRVAFERNVDVASHPILESHALGGKAVLPVALILEWLAHGAIHGNPGLELRGFDDFRVYQGVRLGRNDKAHLRILAGKLTREDSYYKVPMRLLGRVNGRDVMHAAGNVLLAPGFPASPAPILHLPLLRPYSCSLEQAYETRLFHGEKLRGITEIEGVSEDGIVIKAQMAPTSSLWMEDPSRANWLADPLAIDSALQAIILWSQEQRGKPCLPCAIGNYRQYRRALPRNGVRIIIRVQPAAEQLIRCELEFVDLQGLLVASMEGCESIADPSLTLAFRKNQIEA